MYFIPVYRYENVQKGRQREFHQFGIECLGSDQDMSDVETIDLANNILNRLNLKNNKDIVLHINSIGCAKCREEYKKVLKEYLDSNIENYCDDCVRRNDTNILRVLDCKNTKCKSMNKKAPKITDYLCEDCRASYENILEYVNNLENREIVEDPYLVRGLDYYNGIVYEFISKEDGLTILRWRKI